MLDRVQLGAWGRPLAAVTDRVTRGESAPGADPVDRVVDREPAMLEMTGLSATPDLSPQDREKIAPLRLSSDPCTARLARFMLYTREGDSLDQWQSLLSPQNATLTVLRELVASTCEPQGYLQPVDGELAEKTLRAAASLEPTPEAVATLRAFERCFTARAQADLSEAARMSETPARNAAWAEGAAAVLESWNAPPEPPRNAVEQMVHSALMDPRPAEALFALASKFSDPKLHEQFRQNLPALITLGSEAALVGRTRDSGAKSSFRDYYEKLLGAFPEAMTAQCLHQGIGPLIDSGVDHWKSTFNQFWNNKPELLADMMKLGLSLRADFRLSDDALTLVSGCLRRGAEPTPEVRDFMLSQLLFPLRESHTGPGNLALLSVLAEMEKAKPGCLEDAKLPDSTGQSKPWRLAFLDRVTHETIRGKLATPAWNEGSRFYGAVMPAADPAVSGPLLDELERAWPTLGARDENRLGILVSIPLPPEHEERLRKLLTPELPGSRLHQCYLERYSGDYRAEQMALVADRPFAERLARASELANLERSRDDSFRPDRATPLAARALAQSVPPEERSDVLASLLRTLGDDKLMEAHVCMQLLSLDWSLFAQVGGPPPGKAGKVFGDLLGPLLKDPRPEQLEVMTRVAPKMEALATSGFDREEVYRAWDRLLPARPWGAELAGVEGTPRERYELGRRIVDSPRSPREDLSHWARLAAIVPRDELLPTFDLMLAALNRGLNSDQALREALGAVVGTPDKTAGGVDLSGGQVTVGGVRLRTRNML